MIFSELYGVYYSTVAAILRQAVDHPLRGEEIGKIVEANAFGESILTIPSALREERWQVLRADGTTPIRHAPSMPMTTLEKRWLKAILLDPRVCLFGAEIGGLEEVEPLFRPEDILVFDRYADGDDYEDPGYIRRFRLCLDAVREGFPLEVTIQNRHGQTVRSVFLPDHLEYSEKDDKFRMIGTGADPGSTINLGRIVACERSGSTFDGGATSAPRLRAVTFELIDRRNTLERVLLHFAHFEKEARRLDGERYQVTVRYDQEDETELVIRILSFGPTIRVTEPERFVRRIRQRLIDQKSCGL